MEAASNIMTDQQDEQLHASCRVLQIQARVLSFMLSHRGLCSHLL